MKKIIITALVLSAFSQAGDITLTGTVVSDGQKMIGSRFMGYIKKVYVKLGDKVKREDDLYEMESAEFDIMKSQADLMLEQSKIIVEYWRDKLTRINTKKVRLISCKLYFFSNILSTILSNIFSSVFLFLEILRNFF